MSENSHLEPMLDMFIFETTGLIEKLERMILSSETESDYTKDAIDEIFRIMHTIKGSSAMMLFDHISTLAHSMEDIFFFLREKKPEDIDCSSLSDLVLEGIDFIKIEIQKIINQDEADGNPETLIQTLHIFLDELKQRNSSQEPTQKEPKIKDSRQQYYISQEKSKPQTIYENTYKAVVFFEEGCEMENIRAYTVIHNLQGMTEQFHHIPEDIIDNDDTVNIIREKGFTIYLKADLPYEEVRRFFMKTIFLKDLELIQLENDEEFEQFSTNEEINQQNAFLNTALTKEKGTNEHRDKGMQSSGVQSMISVNVDKLDKLMDLVGEMVIAEAMVTQNPDLKDLELENFQKAARQLRKISGDLQDMVMSIRMVPLSNTFHKMQRVVRDMKKKLGKEVQLEIIGEETEVDKNIIEHISDPLMHLVRNAIDHGIEERGERRKKGKSEIGTITLEAKNAGSEVLVTIKDDGRGLNKEKILRRAKENQLLTKPEDEMTDKEICALIFYPGFSTKEDVTEYSGRGVGMDVVTKNIEAVGGSVSIDSVQDKGSVITLKIPLTLAIIDGMNIRVGKARYTLPTTSIKESFRAKESNIIIDPDNNEMIMVRGQCYPIIRLHKLYKVTTEITEISKGIIIMVENEQKAICILADELLGQQQVVVKPLPTYIKNTKNIEGLTGCTLLGDGSISLILDIAGLIQKYH